MLTSWGSCLRYSLLELLLRGLHLVMLMGGFGLINMGLVQVKLWNLLFILVL